MIAIIDYGMGNIHSVQKALETFGAKTYVTNDPEKIKTCAKLVLPGVGAFGDALSELKKQDLISCLSESVKQKKPFLGICLGMQLLFKASDESAGVKGLGILAGKVKKFEVKLSRKVPHMGWNQIKTVSRLASYPVNQSENKNRQTGKQANRQTKKCPLLKDVPDGAYVYFCHSYYPQPADKDIIAATTDYGIDFASVVWQDNLYGVQFHPEKSQSVGLKILKNFVELSVYDAGQ